MSNILNKVVRYTPFLLTPLFVVGQAKNLNSQEVKDKPSQNAPKIKSLLDLSKGFFKLPKLTQEENKTLDEMEEFLIKYTGNGKFNYGSMPRMLEGLKYDYKAVHEEAQSMRGLRRKAALRYPNNLLGFVHRKVQREIGAKAYTEMTLELQFFRVDPNTASEVDNAPIKHFVTKDELDKFTRNSYLLDDMSKKYLPSSKKVIFPDGITIRAIQFIRSREIGIPPGGKIVDKN